MMAISPMNITAKRVERPSLTIITGMMIMTITIHPVSEGSTDRITDGTITAHGTQICTFIPTILFTGEQVFISDLTGVPGVVIIPRGTVPIHIMITTIPITDITARIITDHTGLDTTMDITVGITATGVITADTGLP